MDNNSIKQVGRYVIESEIGRGGMAVVYKAKDPELDRTVAIKLIKVDAFPLNYLEQLNERFKREAKALAKLDHPNIVKILDYGEHEDAPYLVMNYIEGITLKDIKKPVQIDVAVQLLRPVIEALDYVHSQGLVHRDIKPSNIMITKQNQTILTDFGIVKWVDEDNDFATLTGTGIGIGTPEYMSPEQGRGVKLDPKSDMYSLSCVFFELITGQKPYQGETSFDTLMKHATETIPDPSHIIPEIPPSVKRFLEIAMAKRPTDRYSTTNDYLRDFEGLRLQAKKQLSTVNNVLDKNNTTNSNRNVWDFIRNRSTIKHFIILIIGIVFILSIIFSFNKITKINALRLASTMAAQAATQTQERLFVSNTEQAIAAQMTAQAYIYARQTEEILSAQSTAQAATQTQVSAIFTEMAKSTMEALSVQSTAQAATQTQASVISTENAKSTMEAIAAQSTAQAATQTQASVISTKMAKSTMEALSAQSTAQAATQTQVSIFSTQEAKEKEIERINDILAERYPVGSIISFGHFEQDNDFNNGEEPIYWQVLEISDGSAFLLSVDILDAQSFNTDWKNNTWDVCSLRKWLNGKFYDISFSEKEKQQIVLSRIINGNDETYITEDFVFLLSVEEAEKFFDYDNYRRARPSTYAVKQGSTAYTNHDGHARWWLRTQGSYFKNYSAEVYADGKIDESGYDIATKNGGVRPAIKITIND